MNDKMIDIRPEMGYDGVIEFTIRKRFSHYERKARILREETIRCALEEKVVAIVRGVSGPQCLELAQALYDGGIRMMEVTYNQRDPGSWKDTANAISAISEQFAGRLLAGAGTVTTPELVELSRRAGANFIISPDTNPAVIARTRELEMVSMPGAMTPTEILSAHAAGADIVKLFPAAALGPAYLKAILSPLNHIKIMAVGGVDAANVGSFLKAGAAGAGVGGNLVNRGWIAEGRFDLITEAARSLTSAAKQ